jgi:DNA-binding transcriptional MerR regulator
VKERLTTQDVCDQTGIPKTKIKYWVQALNLPVPKDSKGAWRWSPDLVEQILQVQQLRELDGRTLESVRRVIGEPVDSPEAIHEEYSESTEAVPGEFVDSAEVAEAVAAALMPQMKEALAAQNEMAERYARVAHQVGRLEAENDHLRQERDRLAGELAETKALLAAPKEEAKAKPWWRLWA